MYVCMYVSDNKKCTEGCKSQHEKLNLRVRKDGVKNA